MKKIIFIIICLLFNLSYSQVGVNKKSGFNQNAILQVESPTNETKGILTPKYTTAERDAFSFNNGVAKLTAKDDGLLIYNTTENCFNMWVSPDNTWKSLCSNDAPSISVNCANIKVTGEYKQFEELNGSTNYVTIQISVSKAGLYSFVIKRQTDNGFNFVSKFVYLEPTDTSVTLEANRSPLSVSESDVFSIIIQDNTVCSFTVAVKENLSKYRLCKNCC